MATVLAMPRAGLSGTPRYDRLLVVALAIQFWIVAGREHIKSTTHIAKASA